MPCTPTIRRIALALLVLAGGTIGLASSAPVAVARDERLTEVPWDRMIGELAQRGESAAAEGDALARVDAAVQLADVLGELEDALEASDPDAPGWGASLRTWINASLRLFPLGRAEGIAPHGRTPAEHARRLVAVASRGNDLEALALAASLASEELEFSGHLATAHEPLVEALARLTEPHYRGLELELRLGKLHMRRSEFAAAARARERVIDLFADLDAPGGSAQWADYRDFFEWSRASLDSELANALGLPELEAEAVARERAAAEAMGQPALVASAVIHELSALLGRRSSGAFDELIDRADELLEENASDLPFDRPRVAFLRAAALWARAEEIRQARGERTSEDLALLDRAGRDLWALARSDDVERLDPAEHVRLVAWLARFSIDLGLVVDDQTGAPSLPKALDVLGMVPADTLEASGLRGRTAHLAAWLRMQNELAFRLGRAPARAREHFDDLLAEWRAAPIRPGGIGFLRTTDRRSFLSEWMRLEIVEHGEVEGARKAFDTLALVGEAGSRARARGLAFDEPRFAELVAGGGGVVTWLEGPDQSHVVLRDEAGALHVELESWRQLGPAVAAAERAVARAIRSGADPAQLSVVRALGPRVLPPAIAERMATWTRTVLVPGALAGAPFELLELGDGEARLGERTALAFASSLPLLTAIPEDGASPPRTGVVWLAAPEGAPEGLDAIPFAAPERARLASSSRHAVLVHAGADATREQLARGAERALVLGFVVHGSSRIDPRPAGLVLADGSRAGGELWAEDVEDLPAPPLVLLFACGAASGPVRRGEDAVHGLADAFLEAGARAVLATSHDLDSAAAVELGARVVERWLPGELTAAEALRAARAELLAEGSWSPSLRTVRLIGEGGLRAPR